MSSTTEIKDDIIQLGKMLKGLEADFLTMQDRSLEANRIQMQVEADLLALNGKIVKLREILKRFATKVGETLVD